MVAMIEPARRDALAAGGALLTYDDVAQHLRVTRRTVEGLVASGELPSVAIGRLRRFRPADLLAFIEARTCTATG